MRFFGAFDKLASCRTHASRLDQNITFACMRKCASAVGMLGGVRHIAARDHLRGHFLDYETPFFFFVRTHTPRLSLNFTLNRLVIGFFLLLEISISGYGRCSNDESAPLASEKFDGKIQTKIWNKRDFFFHPNSKTLNEETTEKNKQTNKTVAGGSFYTERYRRSHIVQTKLITNKTVTSNGYSNEWRNVWQHCMPPIRRMYIWWRGIVVPAQHIGVQTWFPE